MGRLKRITDLIEHSVPEFTSLKVIQRGHPVFPDILLRGSPEFRGVSVRFAHRLGANFSVLAPHNQTQLSANVSSISLQLPVSEVFPEMDSGVIVTFNKCQMHIVSSVDYANKVVTLSDTTPLGADRKQNEKLYLWAVPILITAPSLSGALSVSVKSKYPILNGDKITFPTYTFINSLKEFGVLTASYQGSTLDVDYPYAFTLTLDQELPFALSIDQQIYLRALPGYISDFINVPDIDDSRMGPFAVDYLASPLDDIPTQEQTFSIKTLTHSGVPILGTSQSFQTISKNYAIMERPLLPENMMFWEVPRGKGNFVYPGKFRLTTDDSIDDADLTGRHHIGRARIAGNFLPIGVTNFNWLYYVTATDSCRLNIVLSKQDQTVADIATPLNLIAHKKTRINIPYRAGYDTLEFIVTSQRAGTYVEFSNAPEIVTPLSQIVPPPVPLQPHKLVSKFQYTYVFNVLGSTNFQATGIILKPQFLSLANLSARYDEGATYNGGYIYI